jgi:hypothetical protein
VNIQACGANDITIGNLRSRPGPLTPINFQRYVYDSFGESLRGFLRRFWTNAALEGPVRMLAREQLAYALGSGCGVPLASSSIVMVDTAMTRLSVAALPDNRIRFAFCEALPPTVIIDHDGDAIRVFEGRSRAIEGSNIEVPFRRSEFPNEPSKIVPVQSQGSDRAAAACGLCPVCWTHAVGRTARTTAVRCATSPANVRLGIAPHEHIFGPWGYLLTLAA